MPPIPSHPRKGATRRADIPAEVLAGLNAGTMETATLAEGLAVDFAHLMRAALPAVGEAGVEALAAAAGEGVSKRMALAGRVLAERLQPTALAALAQHPSDTVRGWAAFAVCQGGGVAFASRLATMRPFADDAHFGVREWAWMALRPYIAADLATALRLLADWSADGSANIRRFASEATRPRGVWCAHIEPLKRDPAPGLPILEPLRADPTKYVQDSVANWLNDAAKTRADWVRGLCGRWAAESPVPATDRIRARALRSLAAE